MSEHAELIAEAKQASHYVDVRPISPQLVERLIAALESQPETTANVDDREALAKVVRAKTFPDWPLDAAYPLADAILAAGFSRAQGEVTVEWSHVDDSGYRYECGDGNEGHYEALRCRNNFGDRVESRTRTVTPWKEDAADE